MKKILLIVVPLIVLGGGFVALAVTGVVNVPGLSPKKSKKATMYGEDATKMYGEAVPAAEKEPADQEPPAAPAAADDPGPGPVVEAVETDPDKGAKKLAQLWNNLPTDKLAAVTKSFQDRELAVVLNKMDPEKVAELLAALDPKRSAQLSKELQKVASIVPKEAG